MKMRAAEGVVRLWLRLWLKLRLRLGLRLRLWLRGRLPPAPSARLFHGRGEHDGIVHRVAPVDVRPICTQGRRSRGVRVCV